MADDPEVKVVVLTGAAAEGAHGGFCSGGDVKDGASGPGGEKGVPATRCPATCPATTSTRPCRCT